MWVVLREKIAKDLSPLPAPDEPVHLPCVPCGQPHSRTRGCRSGPGAPVGQEVSPLLPPATDPGSNPSATGSRRLTPGFPSSLYFPSVCCPSPGLFRSHHPPTPTLFPCFHSLRSSNPPPPLPLPLLVPHPVVPSARSPLEKSPSRRPAAYHPSTHIRSFRRHLG